LDWVAVAIIFLGSAAVGGITYLIAYLLGEYRSMRDRDWS
jgi:hypothetical protein